MKTFYLTTPIYYVNDKPHIGHAYTSLAADTLARFMRLNNNEVFFATGTDEHGQKVEQSANKKNLSVEEFTETNSTKFKNMSEYLNLTNDGFIRTSEIRHKNKVKEIWKKLLEKDQIYLSSYKGWYSIRDEAFIPESEIRTDENNKKIGPSNDYLKFLEEPSYFFKLSNWQQKLLEFYKNNKEFILPKSRYNEVIKFVEGGLEDLSISRTSFSWGIGVPDNEKHVIYVWLDALCNYITILENKSSIFWPADLHIVGKDILRFHAIYWPAFLMAADIKLPKQIFAHGWWTIEGKKMSKSLGNVIDPSELVKKYNPDIIRYFLLREIPFGEDGNFSEILLNRRVNSELSNGYGNLIQRVLSMIYKYFDGLVPCLRSITKKDTQLLNMPIEGLMNIKRLIKNLEFNTIIEEILIIIRAANLYVDKAEPWKLAKSNKERLSVVLSVLINVIYRINILLQPFLPDASRKVFRQMNQQDEVLLSSISKELNVENAISKPYIIFPRIEL